ncbi:hypothetical protein [Sedimenticola sp.]|uniref:hypothetical protein n=1 Tax=Sedimenticola sp. TaxID=1940285 RepID=UPI003D109EC0
MKRKLVITVVIFALVGLVFFLYMLGASLQPSAQAKSERSQHDISTLKPGQYRIEHFGRPDAWSDEVLLIRDWDKKYYAYLLPTENGKVILPDRWWGWGYYHCADFRPELDELGFIKKDGIIKCHDKETREWGISLWEWTYDGSPKDKWGIDMYSPPIEVNNGTLYINR